MYRVEVWRWIDHEVGAGEWVTVANALTTKEGHGRMDTHKKLGERSRLIGPSGQVIADSGDVNRNH